jgi:alkylresorcinol/alkylpyrone synthase
VLSAEVPNLVRDHLRVEVDAFLAECDLTLRNVESFVCHPADRRCWSVGEALALPRDALSVTWESLARVGNISSVSVLLVLEETMRKRAARGSLGLLIGMGPGFCAELVLLGW